MEFTELSRHPLSGGVIRAWSPNAAIDPRRWPRDPRPVSHVQEAHVRSWHTSRVSQGEVPSWLAMAFELDGPLDAGALRTALDQWIDRHDMQRSHVTFDPRHPVHSTAPLARLSLRPGQVHVLTEPGVRVDDAEEACDVLEHMFDVSTVPLAWPNYVFATLEPDDGGPVQVFYAADHGITDAVSIISSAGEIRALYAAACTGAEEPDLGEVGGYPDFCLEQRRRTDRVDLHHPAVRRWQSVINSPEWQAQGNSDFTKQVDFSPPPFDLGCLEYDNSGVRQAQTVDWVLDDRHTEDFSRACRGGGHRFSAAVLGAFAEATRRTTGADTFRCVTTVTTRSEPRWLNSMGWYVGLSPVEIPATGSLDDQMRLAGENVALMRGFAEVPMSRVWDLLDVVGVAHYVVSFMDVRRLPGAADWARAHGRFLRGRTIGADDCYVWVIRSPSGTSVNCRFPDNPIARANVERLVAAWSDVVRSVATQGLDVHVAA